MGDPWSQYHQGRHAVVVGSRGIEGETVPTSSEAGSCGFRLRFWEILGRKAAMRWSAALPTRWRGCAGEANAALFCIVVKHVAAFDRGRCGNIVFELGAAFVSCENWRDGVAKGDGEVADACERAVSLFHERCADARRAVLCWI